MLAEILKPTLDDGELEWQEIDEDSDENYIVYHHFTMGKRTRLKLYAHCDF